MSWSGEPARRWPAGRAVPRLLLVAGTVLALLLPARPAAAHASLVRSRPANGATLAQAPSVALLRFDEDVSDRFSTASLLDRAGRPVPGARPAPGRGGPRLVALDLPALPPGTYGIAWRVLAEDDGHTTSGTVVFTVGSGPRDRAAPDVLAGEPGSAASPRDVVRRWLGLCLLACLIGGLAVAGLVLRRGPPGAVDEPAAATLDRARVRVLAFAAAAGALAAAAGLADLAVEAGRSATGGSASATAADLLTGTRWGHLWLVREAALVALAVLARALGSGPPGRLRHGRTSGWTAAAVLVAVVVTVQALGSHAMAVEPGRPVAVLAAAAHALAACLWLGGLAAFAVVMLRPGASGRPVLLGAFRGRFTPLAAASVGLVVATGAYAAGREVASPGALVDTAYGRALLAKTLLLAAAGGLGLVNSARLHGRAPVRLPRSLARRLGWPASAGAEPVPPRLLTAEAAVGVVLLLVAGLLVETPPPRQAAAVADAGDGAGAESTVLTRTGVADDVVVSFSVTPNQPGANGFTVLAASARRPPVAPIDGVSIQFAGGAAAVPLQETEPGRYFGTAALDGPGPVRASVVIRRAGARLSVPVEWQVPPEEPPAPPPPERLAALGSLLAAVLVAVLGAVGLRWWVVTGRRRRPASEVEQKVLEEVR